MVNNTQLRMSRNLFMAAALRFSSSVVSICMLQFTTGLEINDKNGWCLIMDFNYKKYEIMVLPTVILNHAPTGSVLMKYLSSMKQMSVILAMNFLLTFLPVEHLLEMCHWGLLTCRIKDGGSVVVRFALGFGPFGGTICGLWITKMIFVFNF